ncbi:MAG TPA: hypothetical protein VN493_16990 [Thermoanaerobaculia bacterium]|nr:hypothetical protein [Thermoanaerobaculia bacterium]
MNTAQYPVALHDAFRRSTLSPGKSARMRGCIPILFVGSLCLGACASPGANPCTFDRAKLLALDEHSFDQDMDGGWRAIAQHEECTAVAADLIREYRETRGLTSSILYWHEGQLRAFRGSTDEAIGLFEQSRHADDAFGWNLYVDASIAFLRRDKPALLTARETLASLPRPEDFSLQDAQGNAVEISWPPNLSVVDGLIACFDRGYKEAYGNCRK